MTYTGEMFLEDVRRVLTTIVGGIAVASLIYIFGPDGQHIEHIPNSNKTAIKNDSWSAVTDTYQVISRDAVQPIVTVDDSQYGAVIKRDGDTFVQLNLPKGGSFFLDADRPYDLLKVDKVPAEPKKFILVTPDGKQVPIGSLKLPTIGADVAIVDFSLPGLKNPKSDSEPSSSQINN